MSVPRDGLISDRYKGRPEKVAEIKANVAEWERLREMALEPSLFAGQSIPTEGAAA